MLSVTEVVIVIFSGFQKYRLSKNLQAQANVSTTKNGADTVTSILIIIREQHKSINL
jgi:hypothetical protein